MTTATTGASLAACAIAITFMAIYLRKWWIGGRALKDLAPMIQGFVCGGLATICFGGLAGWLAGCARQAVGSIGGKAVTGTTGTPSGDTLTAGSLGRLSEEGGVVVFFLFVLLVVIYKAAPKDDKARLISFFVAGAVLCVTAGVAGMLDGLPGLINSLGLSGRNMLDGNA
ncbi:hypothetical protein [Streptomyces sp. wa1063]|uniref:hypothetical protein n=1 Tax=Streptomyces sp. wa1063 TaxID=1828212 RepID=UPI000BF11959|nr:hypothetical protein [Streptomyces sp. wa1063]